MEGHRGPLGKSWKQPAGQIPDELYRQRERTYQESEPMTVVDEIPPGCNSFTAESKLARNVASCFPTSGAWLSAIVKGAQIPVPSASRLLARSGSFCSDS